MDSQAQKVEACMSSDTTYKYQYQYKHRRADPESQWHLPKTRYESLEEIHEDTVPHKDTDFQTFSSE